MSRIRRLIVVLIPLVLCILCGCQTVSTPQPTIPPLPPTPIVVTRTPLPRLPTPVTTSITVITVITTATVAPITTKITPIAITDSISLLQDRLIVLMVHFTSSDVTKAQVIWAVDGLDKPDPHTEDVSIPRLIPGGYQSLQSTLTLDVLPPLKSTLTFHWELTGKDGKIVRGKDSKFKITEAIAVDQRNDLPVMASKTTFESHFPTFAVFTLMVTPAVQIVSAEVYVTENHGIEVHNQLVVPDLQVGGKVLHLSFRWDAMEDNQIPWQALESWWVLTDANGKEWRTEHVVNDYADLKFHKWTRTPTKYGVLYTYDQPQAAISTLATGIDNSIQLLQSEFQYKLIFTPHVVVYNTQQDWLDWSPPNLAMEAAGVADPKWGGAIVTFIENASVTGSIIQHELTHVYQFQSIDYGFTLPRWWLEGSARYFEYAQLDDVTGNFDQTTKQIIQRNGAPSLLQPVPDDSPDGTITGAWQYYVGRSFVTFLHEKYGKDAFGETYLEIKQQFSLWAALKIVTGKDSNQLDQEWQQWVKQ